MVGLLLVTGGSLVGTATPRIFQKKERKGSKRKGTQLVPDKDCEISLYYPITPAKVVYTIL